MFFGKERLIPYQGKVSKSFLHRTLTKSNNKSMLYDEASLVTLLMRCHSSSLFYHYIKKWRLEDISRLCNIFTSVKTLSNLVRIKYLEFLINFHILEILKSRVWIVLYFVNISDCISSVQFKLILCNMFVRSLLLLCLSIGSLLLLFLSVESLLLLCMSIRSLLLVCLNICNLMWL